MYLLFAAHAVVVVNSRFERFLLEVALAERRVNKRLIPLAPYLSPLPPTSPPGPLPLPCTVRCSCCRSRKLSVRAPSSGAHSCGTKRKQTSNSTCPLPLPLAPYLSPSPLHLPLAPYLSPSPLPLLCTVRCSCCRSRKLSVRALSSGGRSCGTTRKQTSHSTCPLPLPLAPYLSRVLFAAHAVVVVNSQFERFLLEVALVERSVNKHLIPLAPYLSP